MVKLIKNLSLIFVALSGATIAGFCPSSAQALTLVLNNNSQTIQPPTDGEVVTFSGIIDNVAPFIIQAGDITQSPGFTANFSPELSDLISNQTIINSFSGNLFTVSFTQNFPVGRLFNEAFGVSVESIGGVVDLEIETWSVTVVPEPLTLLGVGTAVGFSAFFKRQVNKKKLK